MTEFKVDLEDYLRGLKESKVRTLEDIINFNDAHSAIEFPPGQGCQEVSSAVLLVLIARSSCGRCRARDIAIIFIKRPRMIACESGQRRESTLRSSDTTWTLLLSLLREWHQHRLPLQVQFCSFVSNGSRISRCDGAARPFENERVALWIGIYGNGTGFSTVS